MNDLSVFVVLIPVVWGFTTRGTTFTGGVAVYIEELGVSAVPPGMEVNNRGNMHPLELDLIDMGDGKRVPPIGVPSRPRGGRPRVILPTDSSEGDDGRGRAIDRVRGWAAFYAHHICAGFYVRLRRECVWWETWDCTLFIWRRGRTWFLFFIVMIT